MNSQDSTLENHAPEGEELNPAEVQKTPLEQVHEQQSLRQKSHDSSEKTPDTTPEVVGQGAPSDRIHHPQRQLYNGKD